KLLHLVVKFADLALERDGECDGFIVVLSEDDLCRGCLDVLFDELLKSDGDDDDDVAESFFDIFHFFSILSLKREREMLFSFVQEVTLAKELVNAPANVVTPAVLVEEAEKITATYSDVITAKILDTEQCLELKMGSHICVSVAFTNPPKFIHLFSLSQDVYLGHVFSDNAQIVWKELEETYDRIDGSIVFNLLQKINSFKQGGLPISEYYHKLNSLWREFDILTKLPDCVCAARAELGDHGKLMKLMQFLMGLDDVYEPIRSSLLTREVLLEVKYAFVILVREESHRGIPATTAKSDKPQAPVFVSRVNDVKRSNSNANWNNGNTSNNYRGNYNSLLCKNYSLTGHTIERCFEIIGYPPRFKKNPNLKVNGTFNNNKSNNADLKGKFVETNDLKTTAGTLSFTHEHVVKLMNLLNDKSGSIIHANMAGVSYHFGWIIDSGANQHMTDNIKNMIHVVDVTDLNLTVGHPNGTLAKITHIGNLILNNNVILSDVLDLKRETVLGTGSESAGLYLFDVDCDKIAVSNQSKYFVCYVSKDVWHNRLGHPANQVLKFLKNSLNLSNINHNSPSEVCHKAKQTRDTFPISDHKSICLGELIHLDVWGPYRVVSREGFKYFLTIVDDFSRSVWVYLLKSKDEVYNMFVNFYKLILTQFEKKIKTVRSDNGTEFVNSKMIEFFNSMGIVHQTSCAYTPQQNGIAERKHRHLLNVARSLMFQEGIPLSFWTECVLTATYLINRLPSSVLNGKSPFSLVYGREPNLSYLRSFGCLCFVAIVKGFDKFFERSKKCVLIRYASGKKSYKLFSLENRNVLYSRDVKFYETVFPFKMNNNDKSLNEHTDISTLNFFDQYESGLINKTPIRPNDDEEC
ncbi:putative RNA-directed DNA polymerase, partial [Tanacetum coccineum]